VLRAKHEWAAVFYLAKKQAHPSSTDSGAADPAQSVLEKWNDSIGQPTGNWKAILDNQSIRAPETLTLTVPTTSKFK
jgi:hypothetical protein